MARSGEVGRSGAKWGEVGQGGVRWGEVGQGGPRWDEVGQSGASLGVQSGEVGRQGLGPVGVRR